MRKFGMHGFAAKKAIYGCDLCVSHIPPGFVFVLFFFFFFGHRFIGWVDESMYSVRSPCDGMCLPLFC